MLKKTKMMVVAVVSCVIMSSVSNAAIIKSYDFNGSLTDTLGNGEALTSLGGNVDNGRYVFSNDQGLKLENALASTTHYGIEIALKIDDSLVGYKKLIDFKNLISDNGVYSIQDKITFYGLGSTGSDPISSGNEFTIAVERSGIAGTISVYLDNDEQFTVADNGDAIPVGNILNFFIDDTADASGSESFAGSVDFIRIHEDASTFGTDAPEPATMSLLAIGGIALIRRRRRA